MRYILGLCCVAFWSEKTLGGNHLHSKLQRDGGKGPAKLGGVAAAALPPLAPHQVSGLADCTRNTVAQYISNIVVVVTWPK